MKQYDIWLADIPAPKDSHVQHGRRPVVIISNNLANTHSPVVTVIPLTSQMNKHQLPPMSTCGDRDWTGPASLCASK